MKSTNVLTPCNTGTMVISKSDLTTLNTLRPKVIKSLVGLDQIFSARNQPQLDILICKLHKRIEGLKEYPGSGLKINSTANWP